jgi:hypothetical protein
MRKEILNLRIEMGLERRYEAYLFNNPRVKNDTLNPNHFIGLRRWCHIRLRGITP